MDQDATWYYGGRPRPRRHCIRWGPILPPQKGGSRGQQSSSTFRPVYCGQTAGWIKMPLGTEVGLGPSHIVLDGDPAHHPSTKKGTQPPILAHVCCGQTAALIKMPLGTKVGVGTGDTVLDGDPAPHKRAQPCQFSAHVYCGETVDHLSYC